MLELRPPVLLALLAFVLANSAEARQDQLLTLPEGDVVRGRQAFVDLKCNSCHRVSGDPDMSAPVASLKAPDLGVKLSRHKPGYLADSIMYPSNAVLDEQGRFAHFYKEASRMGDFTDTMTIRQLADIVAYLRQLDEEV